jgi:hypothetical protein
MPKNRHKQLRRHDHDIFTSMLNGILQVMPWPQTSAIQIGERIRGTYLVRILILLLNFKHVQVQPPWGK